MTAHRSMGERVNMLQLGRTLCLCVAVWLGAPPAEAMMAGALPDTPAARVDANTASSPWTSVVSILIGSGVYSGVVVAPRYVLTAAHVAGGSVPASITVQVNATSTPVTIAATAVATFPSASFPYDDLSLITLASPVPTAVTILPIHRSNISSGEMLTLVGYGASGNGDVGVSVSGSASIKRTGRNAADFVQTTIDASGRTSLFYLFDFDGPSGTGAFGGTTLGNAAETCFSFGDSGSPAFADIGGQRWLIGINNFVATTNGAAVDYKFGTLGGGILLSDPRFIAWLETQTGNTLASPSDNVADAPVPVWAMVVLVLGLGGAMRAKAA